MVATSAFGLGIDYGHVHDVICFGLPYSLEDYVQQIGRARRNGNPSSAVLMYNSKREWWKFDQMTEGRAKASFGALLTTMKKNVGVCRRRALSRYFDETEVSCSYVESCNLCDVCGAIVGHEDMEDSFFSQITDEEIRISTVQSPQLDVSYSQELVLHGSDHRRRKRSSRRPSMERAALSITTGTAAPAHHGLPHTLLLSLVSPLQRGRWSRRLREVSTLTSTSYSLTRR